MARRRDADAATNAGKLDRIAGVAIGEMYKCEEYRQPEPWLRSRSMEDVFEHHLEPLGVPILHNLPLGHGDHLCTIPLGVTATIDADARTLTFAEPALKPRLCPHESRRDPVPSRIPITASAAERLGPNPVTAARNMRRSSDVERASVRALTVAVRGTSRSKRDLPERIAGPERLHELAVDLARRESRS